MESGRYSAMFAILVWTVVLAFLAYSSYVKMQHNVELINIEFKSFEDILDGNS